MKYNWIITYRRKLMGTADKIFPNHCTEYLDSRTLKEIHDWFSCELECSRGNICISDCVAIRIEKDDKMTVFLPYLNRETKWYYWELKKERTIEYPKE